MFSDRSFPVFRFQGVEGKLFFAGANLNSKAFRSRLYLRAAFPIGSGGGIESGLVLEHHLANATSWELHADIRFVYETVSFSGLENRFQLFWFHRSGTDRRCIGHWSIRNLSLCNQITRKESREEE